MNVSIVLYHNSIAQIRDALAGVLGSESVHRIFLVDNSADDRLRDLAQLDPRIEYEYAGSNLGFGRGHNQAIGRSLAGGETFHLVMNPDISFSPEALDACFAFMKEHLDIGLLMPRVYFPDGTFQYLCKLLPTPMDLMLRRFIPDHFRSLVQRANNRYELRFWDHGCIADIPSLSGCFMLMRLDALRDVGLFDERYFMYMEDVDLCRRIAVRYRCVFFPEAAIVHGYNRESARNARLFFVHVASSLAYFGKWGWFRDPERRRVNARCLSELRNAACDTGSQMEIASGSGLASFSAASQTVPHGSRKAGHPKGE